MGFFDQPNMLGSVPSFVPDPQPVVEPQPVVAQAPAPVAPYGLVNPMNYTSGNTVLAQDDRQQKLGGAFDKLLQSVTDGPDLRQSKLAAGSQIFNGAAAVLGGLVGGGAAQAGLDLVKHTEQSVRDAKIERRQRYSDALTGLTSLSNIVNSTSPQGRYAVANALKAANDFNSATNKAESNKIRDAKNKEMADFHNRSLVSKERHDKATEQLKDFATKAGIQLNYDKLKTATAMQNARIAAAKQLAQFEQAKQDGRLTAQMAMRAQELAALMVRYNETERRAAAEFDADMQEKLSKVNASGEASHKSVEIPKLLDSAGVDFEISNPMGEDEAAINTANQIIGAAPPQATAPQNPNVPSDAHFQMGLQLYQQAQGPTQQTQAKNQWVQALQMKYPDMTRKQVLDWLASKGVK